MSDQIPPGYRFMPTDEELITDYLLKRVLGEELPSKIVIEGELNVDDMLVSGNDDEKEKYILTKLKKKHKKGRQINRMTKYGSWNFHSSNPITDESKKRIGTKRYLTLTIEEPGRKKKLLMDEYELDGSMVPRNVNSDTIEPTPEIVVGPSPLQLDPPSDPSFNFMSVPSIDMDDVFEAAERNPVEETPIEIHVSPEGEDDCKTSIDREIIEENSIQQTPFQNIAVWPSNLLPNPPSNLSVRRSTWDDKAFEDGINSSDFEQ